MRKPLRLILILLLALGGGISMSMYWAKLNVSRVSSMADGWAKNWLEKHPLSAGDQINWKGFHWSPWTDLGVAEIELWHGQDTVVVHGLSFSGLSYWGGTLRVDSLCWDSLVVQGIPSGDWLHVFDPWMDSTTSLEPLDWNIGYAGGKICYQNGQSGPSWQMELSLKEASDKGLQSMKAIVQTPWESVGVFSVSGQVDEVTGYFQMDIEHDIASFHAQWIQEEPNWLIQWDITGNQWEGSASGVMEGDLQASSWKLLGTQGTWLSHAFEAEGGFENGQLNLISTVHEKGMSTAKFKVTGDVDSLQLIGYWDQWQPPMAFVDLEGFTLEGSILCRAYWGEDWSIQWQAKGEKASFAGQSLQKWNVQGDANPTWISTDFYAVTPDVGKWKLRYKLGEDQLSLHWAWNQEMHMLDSLGIPASGAVKGVFSWANGGSAHFENAQNNGMSPILLDWMKDLQGHHRIEARLGHYYAEAETALSPLDWNTDVLPRSIHEGLNQWLDGDSPWLNANQVNQIRLDGPFGKIILANKNGRQSLMATGDGLLLAEGQRMHATDHWALHSERHQPNLLGTMTTLNWAYQGMGSTWEWVTRKGSPDQLEVRFTYPEDEAQVSIALEIERNKENWNVYVNENQWSWKEIQGEWQSAGPAAYNWIENRLLLGNGLSWHNDPEHPSIGTLRLQGALSPEPYEVMRILYADVPLKVLNDAFLDLELPLEGTINGQCILAGSFGQWNTSADLAIQGLQFENQDLGTFHSQWELDIESGKVAMHAQAGWPELLWLEATGEKRPEWDIEANLLGVPIRWLTPVTEGSIEDWSGQLNAELVLRQKKGNWSVQGNGLFDALSFYIPKTGVQYTGSPQLDFQEQEIRMHGILEDPQRQGKIWLDGGIDLAAPKGKIIDMTFHSPRCLALDLEKGEDFYGRVRADIDARLTGGWSGLRLDVSGQALDSSIFVLPVNSPITLEEAGFMQFSERPSPMQMPKKIEKTEDFAFDFHLQMKVTPKITTRIILDETVGDVLEGQGSGSLDVVYSDGGELQLNGLVTLEKGTYLFTLENVLNKPFTVNSGATLSWTGDPYHAQVNLTALYKTRTNPGPYLGLTSQERLPVDVALHVTDDLMQPNLAFDIALPTASSAIQAALQSRLVTNDEKTTQVLSLLTLHSFWSNAQGWTATGLNAVGTNTTQVLAQQFSNFMTQGLGENWDVQLAYGKSPQVFQRQMDARVGRSFLDERLTVTTEWGIPLGSQQTPMGMGDVTLAYKISEDGRWTANAYSVRNNDMAFTGQPMAQKQGIGIQLQWTGTNWIDIRKQLKNKP